MTDPQDERMLDKDEEILCSVCHFEELPEDMVWINNKPVCEYCMRTTGIKIITEH